jgi:hypothetical protein
MNEILIRLVVKFACFFELVDEKSMESSLALQQLEEIKWELQDLSKDQKNDMVRVIHALSKEIPPGPRHDKQRRCLDELPRVLDLLEEEETNP